MDLLLTKKIPATSVDALLNQGWHTDLVDALKIIPVDVESLPVFADVWILSSRNSLEVAMKFLYEPPKRIYVVGEWLKEKLSKSVASSLILSFQNMKSLASDLSSYGFDTALYFCGDHHRDELKKTLVNHDRRVHEVITHTSECTFPVLQKNYDAVMLFSPRSAESILQNNRFDAATIFACIGPTTEAYLKSKNINNTFCPTYPDSEILVSEFLQTHPQASKR